MQLNHKKLGFSTELEGELRENFLNLDQSDDFQLQSGLKREVFLIF